MTVTIHQPEHLPYFGFLDKINKSDVFVLLDDVDLKKNNFQNRNQILTQNGSKWVSIPIEMKNLENKHINARLIKDNWKINYRNQIVEAYKKYDYFKIGISIVDEMLNLDSNLLIDFNMFYIQKLLDVLSINTKLIMSSSLSIKTTKTQRLYDICKLLDGSSYLAGQGSIDYLDENIFKNDIKLIKHNFSHPIYEQKNSNEFIPYMSSLDFIMSVGIDRLKEMLNESKKSFM